MALFASHGFRGVTTSQLADAAGISEAMIYKIFGDKRALYQALIERKIAAGHAVFASEAAEAKNDREFFLQTARELLGRLKKDPSFMRLLLYAALEENELASMFYEQRIREVTDFVAQYIQKRIDDGAFRPTIDASLTAQGFLGMIVQYAMSHQIFAPGRSGPWDATKAVTCFVEVVLCGLML